MPAAFALLLVLAIPAVAQAQTCTEPHYRWSEKTTLSLASLTPVHTTIASMLGSWGIPATYGAADKCKARTGVS